MTVSGRNYTVDEVRPDSIEEIPIVVPDSSFEPCSTTVRIDQEQPISSQPAKEPAGTR